MSTEIENEGGGSGSGSGGSSSSSSSGPTYGWQSTLQVGGVSLKNASNLNVEVTRTTEEVDVMGAEDNEWYVYNKLGYTITFTLKAFNIGGSAATEIETFQNACQNGTVLAMALDGVSGNFICTKCSANREAGKVVSYSVELKPTITSAS